jgi:hypothetical protein
MDSGCRYCDDDTCITCHTTTRLSHSKFVRFRYLYMIYIYAHRTCSVVSICSIMIISASDVSDILRGAIRNVATVGGTDCTLQLFRCIQHMPCFHLFAMTPGGSSECICTRCACSRTYTSCALSRRSSPRANLSGASQGTVALPARCFTWPPAPHALLRRSSPCPAASLGPALLHTSEWHMNRGVRK